MGIAKFFNKIKKLPGVYKSMDRKFDYLFLDFQSIIYTRFELFSNEINYFIRALMSTNSQDPQILMSILNNYSSYFISIYGKELFSKLEDSNILTLRETLVEFDYKSEKKIIDFLSEDIHLHVSMLQEKYILNKSKPDTLLIFFDGIPSLAKIKEQVNRRVAPVVLAQIKAELYVKCIDRPPSIGVGTPLIEDLKEKLKEIKNTKIIDELLGEAEHTLMNYLPRYKDKSILISSPDADLILLSMLGNLSGTDISIIRQTAEQIKTDLVLHEETIRFDYYSNIGKVVSPFQMKYEFMNVRELQNSLKIDEVRDIVYILLLLGDDFVPGTPSLNIDNLDDIIKITSNFVKTDGKIINEEKDKFTLNIPNLINLLNIFSIFASRNIPKERRQYAKFNLDTRNPQYNLLMKNIEFYQIPPKEIKKFTDYYLLETGHYWNNRNYKNLFFNTEIPEKTTDEKIKNYLEGYIFIHELYINNNVPNWKWVYNYRSAPSLQEVSKYLVEDKKPFPELVSDSDYFTNNEEYKSYLASVIRHNLIKIIQKVSAKSFDEIDKNFDNEKKQVFKYENVEKLFDFTFPTYLSKAIPEIDLLPILSYKQKYQIIKKKYFQLKNI